MKKHCLFSLVLLLSSNAQYTCAMQGHRDLVAELRNPTTVCVNGHIDDTLDEECSICLEIMRGDDQNTRKLQWLACGHAFHYGCIENVRALDQGCPVCRESIVYAVPAIKAQSVEPMQSIQVAQPTRPVEQHLHVLNERQQKILQDLIDQGLSNNLESRYIRLMCNAYSDPLILANSDFMAVLTDAQRALVQEFIDLAFDPQDIRQTERAVYPELNEQEHALLMQLIDGLKNLQRDDVDTVLIEAYTNPYILIQSSVLTAILNNEQKALVDYLLACYTQRITQEV